MKYTEYFQRGKLVEPYYSELMRLKTPEEQEEYGVGIVLSAYDSHLPLGDGALVPDVLRYIILKLLSNKPNIVILHELKNSKKPQAALSRQIERFWHNSNDS
jgi:hypothetical protein